MVAAIMKTSLSSGNCPFVTSTVDRNENNSVLLSSFARNACQSLGTLAVPEMRCRGPDPRFSLVFRLIRAVSGVSCQSSTFFLKFLYCSCPNDSTLRTDAAAAADSHTLLSKVTRSLLLSSKGFPLLSNSSIGSIGSLV